MILIFLKYIYIYIYEHEKRDRLTNGKKKKNTKMLTAIIFE